MTQPTATDTREIDRQIAERLGWRFERINDTPVSWGNRYRVFKPDNTHCYFETAYGNENNWPESMMDIAYPEYSTDMNAAITLLGQVSDKFTPRLVRMILPMGAMMYGWKCVIMPNVGDDEEFEAIEDTPALAICRAYLAYTAAAPEGGE